MCTADGAAHAGCGRLEGVAYDGAADFRVVAVMRVLAVVLLVGCHDVVVVVVG